MATDRIYLIPYDQSNNAIWHYIDGATGIVVAYAHGTGITANEAYWGGVYDPTKNRIYFAPYCQATQTNWHYINCTTGVVVAYAHGVSAENYAYTYVIKSPPSPPLVLCSEEPIGSDFTLNNYIYLKSQYYNTSGENITTVPYVLNSPMSNFRGRITALTSKVTKK